MDGVQSMKFSDLKLGFASAEEESVSEPALLIDGYFDLNGIIKEVRYGSKFLILGYKGSGKSAISEHLKLTAQQESQLFVNTVFLGDFPYTDFKSIIKGDSEPEARYPLAWSWLLLLSLFDSFAKDEGSQSNRSGDFAKTIQTLRGLCLLPSPSLRQVVIVSSKKSFSLKL